MTNYKTILISTFFLIVSCNTSKDQKLVSLNDSSLTSIFEQLAEKSNPFEFYKDIFENFRFELKSSLIQTQQTENTAPPESVTVFENNDQDESRFFKKSLDPISEVEWTEKNGKDFIRYDDSKHLLRTSYNPEFEKWKRRIFQDIESVFDLKELEKNGPKIEKNQWSCYETTQQKICLDSKTGLPIFGKAIKKLKANTAVSMVFSLTYGENALPSAEPEDKEPPPQKPKKQTLQKRK